MLKWVPASWLGVALAPLLVDGQEAGSGGWEEGWTQGKEDWQEPLAAALMEVEELEDQKDIGPTLGQVDTACRLC